MIKQKKLKNEEHEFEEDVPWKDSIIDQKIVKLKGNVILKGLVPLKILFDKNDILAKVSKKIGKNILNIAVLMQSSDEPWYCIKDVANPKTLNLNFQLEVHTNLEVEFLYAQ